VLLLACDMLIPPCLRVRAGAEVAASPRLAIMVLHFMAKSNKVVPKKRRGRPATGRDPVTAIRLSKEMRAKVDQWAEEQADEPGRSEAIRRLVEIGLTVKPAVRPSAKAAARAAELAAKVIDRHIDPKAPTEEREVRKQRLLKGPPVFRDLRKDLAK